MSATSFSPVHLETINATADAKAALALPGFPAAIERLAALGLAKTIVGGGAVLGVMGAVPTVPGVCEVFVVSSIEQKEFPLAFARGVRRELFTLKEKYRRIQSVARDDEFHARWLSWLGFQREGLLKQYGLGGEDMVMWGLV